MYWARRFGTEATTVTSSTVRSPFAAKSTQAKQSTCGSSDSQSVVPDIVRGMENKTIEDLKDMHVETVDEEDKPFSWKNPATGKFFSIFPSNSMFMKIVLKAKSVGQRAICGTLSQLASVTGN